MFFKVFKYLLVNSTILSYSINDFFMKLKEMNTSLELKLTGHLFTTKVYKVKIASIL
jgi:hypothetical protein